MAQPQQSNSLIFYNPKLSAFKVDISTLKHKLQITIAPSKNPQQGGRPQAGQLYYNWDDEFRGNFSLTITECWLLARNWDDIVDGLYVDPKQTNKDYANQMTITHFTNNISSRISFKPMMDQSGKQPNGFVGVSLMKAGAQKALMYPLRVEEQEIFKELLIHMYKDFPFQMLMEDAKGKAQRFYANQNSTHPGGSYAAPEDYVPPSVPPPDFKVPNKSYEIPKKSSPPGDDYSDLDNYEPPPPSPQPEPKKYPRPYVKPTPQPQTAKQYAPNPPNKEITNSIDNDTFFGSVDDVEF